MPIRCVTQPGSLRNPFVHSLLVTLGNHAVQPYPDVQLALSGGSICRY